MKKQILFTALSLLLTLTACDNPSDSNADGEKSDKENETSQLVDDGSKADTQSGCNYSETGNLVKNASFEEPSVGSAWKTYTAGNDFESWKTESGSVDIVGETLKPGHGKQSLDLDGSSPGAVSQEIETEAGSSYQLSFCLAGNPGYVKGTGIKEVEVFWGDSSVGKFSFDTTGKDLTEPGWETKTISILSDKTKGSKTILKFVSTNEAKISAYGPEIDGIALIKE